MAVSQFEKHYKDLCKKVLEHNWMVRVVNNTEVVISLTPFKKLDFAIKEFLQAYSIPYEIISLKIDQ